MRANRPSRTAKQVAMAIPFLAEDPELLPLLPAGSVEAFHRLLHAAGLLKPRYIKLFRSERYRRFVAGWERFLDSESQVLNIGVRKRYLDEETRTALAGGADQVLVVGAGLDTLTLRLAEEFPHATLVEIDHPATQPVKRQALEEIGLPPNLHLVPADLASTSLANALEASPWRRGRRGVVVAEGLLMYLAPAAVERFFDAVRQVCERGSRVLFTYMRPGADGEPYIGRGSRFTRAMFRLFGEELSWCATPETLGALLRRHGFEPFPANRLDLRERFLEPAGLGHLQLGGIEYAGGGELSHG